MSIDKILRIDREEFNNAVDKLKRIGNRLDNIISVLGKKDCTIDDICQTILISQLGKQDCQELFRFFNKIQGRDETGKWEVTEKDTPKPNPITPVKVEVNIYTATQD